MCAEGHTQYNQRHAGTIANEEMVANKTECLHRDNEVNNTAVCVKAVEKGVWHTYITNGE